MNRLIDTDGSRCLEDCSVIEILKYLEQRTAALVIGACVPSEEADGDCENIISTFGNAATVRGLADAAHEMSKEKFRVKDVAARTADEDDDNDPADAWKRR